MSAPTRDRFPTDALRNDRPLWKLWLRRSDGHRVVGHGHHHKLNVRSVGASKGPVMLMGGATDPAVGCCGVLWAQVTVVLQ